jgi:hypothetical protein
MACAHSIQDEFTTEFLRVLRDCVALQQEQDAAEVDEGGDAPPHVH